MEPLSADASGPEQHPSASRRREMGGVRPSAGESCRRRPATTNLDDLSPENKIGSQKHRRREHRTGVRAAVFLLSCRKGIPASEPARAPGKPVPGSHRRVTGPGHSGSERQPLLLQTLGTVSRHRSLGRCCRWGASSFAGWKSFAGARRLGTTARQNSLLWPPRCSQVSLRWGHGTWWPRPSVVPFRRPFSFPS